MALALPMSWVFFYGVVYEYIVTHQPQRKPPPPLIETESQQQAPVALVRLSLIINDNCSTWNAVALMRLRLIIDITHIRIPYTCWRLLDPLIPWGIHKPC